MKRLFCLTIYTIFTYMLNAQIITGHLSLLQNQEIKLEAFDGFQAYTVAQTITDDQGYFTLNYSPTDYGAGYLISKDGKAYNILLTGEDVEINGAALSMPETIATLKGKENQWFEQYAQEHPRREQALSAWNYLEKIYQMDSLFSKQHAAVNAISHEKVRIKAEDESFLNSLPPDSYVRWFLSVRKLLSSLSIVAQFRPEEIPSTRTALRALRYDDHRLYKSGLFRDAIDHHVWFIENSSGSLDSVFSHLNRSLDIILSQLSHDEKKYNAFTDYLFNLLEKRSLFSSAEYLSLRVLEDNSCTVEDKLANKLEGYRKLKKGQIAPDILFGEHTYYPEHIVAQSLREIPAQYKVVVFASSGCSHCQEALPRLSAVYPSWRDRGIEVVLISLDDSMRDFVQWTAPMPFVSTCDYKSWEGQAVLDYHVFGTPTYYILKEDLEIVLKPASVEQMTAYFDFYR